MIRVPSSVIPPLVATRDTTSSNDIPFSSISSPVAHMVFSTIRMIVTTRNGVITSCKVICDAKEGQMDLVTDENEEAWAKAVVETQGAELDAVTGATVSSDAVREAVAEILEKIR